MVRLKKKIDYAYIAFILVLIALILLFSFRVYHSYSSWRSYHNYLNQPNPQIEPWMNVRMISARFNITTGGIFKEMNNKTSINPHISLDRFCTQYNQNCTDLVERLNLAIKK
jgi:hypothetical protein